MQALPRVCNPFPYGSSTAFQCLARSCTEVLCRVAVAQTSSVPSRRVNETPRTRRRRVPTPRELPGAGWSGRCRAAFTPRCRPWAAPPIDQAHEPSVLTVGGCTPAGGCRYTALGCPKRLARPGAAPHAAGAPRPDLRQSSRADAGTA